MAQTIDVLSNFQGQAAEVLAGTIQELAKEATKNLPESLSPLLADSAAEDMLKKTAPRQAIQDAHNLGWRKGVLVGAVVVAVGIAFLFTVTAKKEKDRSA